MRNSKNLITKFLLLLFLPCWATENYQPAKGYHDYDALSKSLKMLAKKNSSITRLISIGKTLQKRDIWAMQISGTEGKAAGEKQALLICGNLEGDHVVGSEVALGIIEQLITGYGEDAEITRILNKRTFYIIPRLNPDGAELFFKKPLHEYSGNLRPRDDDYDWEIDEDGPEDLNSDGLITLMRVKDKAGDWYIDSKDPRLMRKKEKNTPLDSLYQLYPEGIDNDGDGLYNEDGVGGFNINRNFPHNFGYQIKGYQVYPASEIETRAVIDFMNRYDPAEETAPHKNICAVLIFSKYDNLAVSPGIECGEATFPEFKSKEIVSSATSFRFDRRRMGAEQQQAGRAKDPQPRKTDDDDMFLFQTVSDQYKKITGIVHAVSEKPVGSMLEWGYFQYGVPSFSANLWSLRKEKEDGAADTVSKKPESPEENLPQRRSIQRENMSRRFSGMGAGAPAKAEAENTDQQWLRWIDEHNAGVGFVNWQSYQHKQLGEVEIGGFYPYLRVNPSIELVDSLVRSHTKFALYLASQFAEISMDKPVVEKMSSNLYRLKIKIHNSGILPYASAMGIKSRNISPIVMQIKFENDEEMKLFGGNKRIDIMKFDAGAEREFEWIIISPPNRTVDVRLWARNGGGTTTKKVALK